MKINKQIVNLLRKRKEMVVRDLLGTEGLGLIVASTGGGCEKNVDSLEQIDEILYTLQFLEHEELIKEISSDNHVIYHIGDCLKDDLKKDEIMHLILTQEILEKYYNRKFAVQIAFFNFTDYWLPFLKYKTEKQRKEIINFWLPIGVAILVSVLTAIFNKIWCSCN